MKRTLLIALTLATFGANAQQKLIGSNTYFYDATGAVQFIDSNEFVYNSWDGSLFSNEPLIVFDGAVFDWWYQTPDVKWDVQNNYSGNSFPLILSQTYNNTIVGGDVSVSESASQRTEFTYDVAGNITSRKYFNYNGTSFELIAEQTFEYDANNNKLVEQQIYQGGATPQVESIDSSFYDVNNNMIRSISFQWDGISAFYASSESLITYMGSEISNIILYQGDQSTPLEAAYDIDYTYLAGQPTGIVGYQVLNGVPQTTPNVEFEYTYGANNKISTWEVTVGGDLNQQKDYTYDAQGFITGMVRQQLDFNTQMLFEAENSSYYYQSTADLDEQEIAEATISPNPSSDFISISTDSEIDQVSIYGMNGSIMLTQTSGDIDISTLPAGVYIAKVKTSTGIAQARFVKQ